MPNPVDVVDLAEYRSQRDARRRRELVATLRDVARELSVAQLEAILRRIARETGRADLLFPVNFNG